VSARSALEELDFAAVLAELRNQEERGHTAAADYERPLEIFADKAHVLANELGDVLRRGERQNLDVAYRRAARLAAFSLATMRRIQRARAACNTALEDPAACDHNGGHYREAHAAPGARRCAKCRAIVELPR
jgi:hypothetical protein